MPFSAADAAAAWLLDLRHGGRQAVALPEELRPGSIDDGYDIQDRLVALIGEPVAGWKLGVGSAKQRAETGAGGSIAGRIFAPRNFEPGATIAVPPGPVTIEFEIAFVIGRAIYPDDILDRALDAVSETRVTFELVRSRFFDRRAVGWPSFAADNAAFEALVTGPVVDSSQIPEIAQSAVVFADGTEKARLLTGEDATDPIQAYDDFVALARKRRMVLPQGAIISTGTVTKPFNVEGKVEIEARFLGQSIGFRMESVA